MPIRFIFLRDMDDIQRTVEGDSKKVLRVANFLHSFSQFTLETPSTSQKLDFFYLQNNGIIGRHL